MNQFTKINKKLQWLTDLNLYYHFERFGEDGACYLGQDNEIGNNGVEKIGENLGKCLNLMQLCLNLEKKFRRIKIDEDGQSFIQKGTENCLNLIELTLDLSYNQIEQNFTSFLENNNQLNCEGTLKLSQGFSICQNLTKFTLNLSCNKIDQEGVFKESVSKDRSRNSQKPESHQFSSQFNKNKIGMEGASKLGEGISKCKNLSLFNINLSINKINDGGLLVNQQVIAKI
ncbi:hypothetical protein ABPG72_013904 [Tetrahymena utriculariae]